MFNSKKALALCATTLASFSALGSLPQVVLADVPKAGDTVVTYEGAPQPAEWGISVPATIKLDKSGNVGTDSGTYGIGKLAIVTENGSDYVDSVKDHTFNIYGAGTSEIGEKTLYVGSGNQGGSEPTGWIGSVSSNFGDDLDFDFVTKADGSNVSPSMYVNFGVKDKDSGTINAGDSTTISWSATEK